MVTKKATYPLAGRLLSFISWLRLSLIRNTIAKTSPTIDATEPRTVSKYISITRSVLSLDFPMRTPPLEGSPDDSSVERRTAYRFGNAQVYCNRTYVRCQWSATRTRGFRCLLCHISWMRWHVIFASTHQKSRHTSIYVCRLIMGFCLGEENCLLLHSLPNILSQLFATVSNLLLIFDIRPEWFVL